MELVRLFLLSKIILVFFCLGLKARVFIKDSAGRHGYGAFQDAFVETQDSHRRWLQGDGSYDSDESSYSSEEIPRDEPVNPTNNKIASTSTQSNKRNDTDHPAHLMKMLKAKDCEDSAVYKVFLYYYKKAVENKDIEMKQPEDQAWFIKFAKESNVEPVNVCGPCAPKNDNPDAMTTTPIPTP